MNISPNNLLILGILCFYLYDSIKLQESSKIYVTQLFRGWGIVKPIDLFSISKKVPSLPNPLTPFFSVILLDWSTSIESTNSSEFVAPKYLPLQIFSFLIFIELLVFLPIAISLFGMGGYVLFLIVLTYMTIISSLITLYAYRIKYRISPKIYFSIVLDCLACPPFAINLLRRVTLINSPKQDLFTFAKENFNQTEFQNMLKILISKLNYQIDFADLDSQYYSELVNCRQHYQELQNVD